MLGAGLLCGTALAVIIPEGVHALYEEILEGKIHPNSVSLKGRSHIVPTALSSASKGAFYCPQTSKSLEGNSKNSNLKSFAHRDYPEPTSDIFKSLILSKPNPNHHFLFEMAKTNIREAGCLTVVL